MTHYIETPVGCVEVDKDVAQFFKSRGSEVRTDA